MFEVGWCRFIKESFQKHLKIGVGKGKSYSWGKWGLEGVTIPASPPNIYIFINRSQKTLKLIRSVHQHDSSSGEYSSKQLVSFFPLTNEIYFLCILGLSLFPAKFESVCVWC